MRSSLPSQVLQLLVINTCDVLDIDIDIDIYIDIDQP